MDGESYVGVIKSLPTIPPFQIIKFRVYSFYCEVVAGHELPRQLMHVLWGYVAIATNPN